MIALSRCTCSPVVLILLNGPPARPFCELEIKSPMRQVVSFKSEKAKRGRAHLELPQRTSSCHRLQSIKQIVLSWKPANERTGHFDEEEVRLELLNVFCFFLALPKQSQFNAPQQRRQQEQRNERTKSTSSRMLSLSSQASFSVRAMSAHVSSRYTI